MHGSVGSANFAGAAAGSGGAGMSPANTNTSVAGGLAATGSTFDAGVLWSLVILLLLYVAWAYLETHERVSQSIQPRNIGLNLRNIGLVTFTAVIGINLGRILFAKLAALNVPGAAYMLTVWGNA